MAELSEMYQASLRPHPPYKPLPDETGFVNYFSPPAVATDDQGNYVPYYYYPPLFPQPAPPPLPALPPPPGPYGYSGKGRTSKTQGRISTDSNQAMESFMMYAALVVVLLILFTLAIMLGYAMAGKYSPQGKGSQTERDSVDYSTRPTDNSARMRRAAMVEPSNNKASPSRPRRHDGDEVHSTT